MSEKELLYLEDALAHEEYMIKKCQNYARTFKNSEFVALAKTWEQKHQTIFDSLYRLIG